MGFMDRLKAGAEQAKDMAADAAGQAKDLAGEAASRARQEARELQLRRDLNEAYDDLGRTAFELWDTGGIAHPHLESRSRRIKGLRDELERVEAGEDLGDEGGEPHAPEPMTTDSAVDETPPPDRQS